MGHLQPKCPKQGSDCKSSAKGNPLLPCPLLTEILAFPTSPSPTPTHHAKLCLGKRSLGAQPKSLVVFSHASCFWLEAIKPMEVPQLASPHPKAPAVRAAPQGIPAGSPGKPELRAAHPAAALPGAGSAGSEQSLIKTKEARKGMLLLGNNTS